MAVLQPLFWDLQTEEKMCCLMATVFWGMARHPTTLPDVASVEALEILRVCQASSMEV